jgi:hypothetical protein
MENEGVFVLILLLICRVMPTSGIVPIQCANAAEGVVQLPANSKRPSKLSRIHFAVAANEYSNVVGERFWRDYSKNESSMDDACHGHLLVPEVENVYNVY